MSQYSRRKEDSKLSAHCDFCKAAASDQTVLDTKYFFVLSNKYPYENNHVLLLPKRHLNSERDFDDVELSQLQEIHLYILDLFYAHFGMCFYFTRENTPDQSMWHWHRHYIPTDYVLRNGIQRVPYTGLTINFINLWKYYI